MERNALPSRSFFPIDGFAMSTRIGQVLAVVVAAGLGFLASTAPVLKPLHTSVTTRRRTRKKAPASVMYWKMPEAAPGWSRTFFGTSKRPSTRPSLGTSDTKKTSNRTGAARSGCHDGSCSPAAPNSEGWCVLWQRESTDRSCASSHRQSARPTKIHFNHDAGPACALARGSLL